MGRMSLVDWQQRLEQHFEQLRRQRTGSVGDRPIFALEHGLAPTELSQLERDVRSHIAGSPPLKEHSLPWVVYAAEIGYRYAGDEYWQTFAAETPYWTIYGDRYWIRRRFVEFQKRFGGAQPSGKWAEQFSIICWPILHAILPTDLQQQLAKVLYEIRFSFTADLFASPIKLGHLIAARSWNANSRFRNLVQEPLLLGQIATALLLHDQQENKSLIFPSTLQRIASDLERERQARNWLLDARGRASHAQFRGLKSANATNTRLPNNEADVEVAGTTADKLVPLGIEPRMILQRAEGELWDVFLEIPDLSPLLLRFPAFHEFLANSRCIVAGASESPLWLGRVLRGSQRVRMARWPRADEPLLRFERTSPQLDYILRTESFRRPGSSWLFRMAKDGRAYEMRSQSVRAGSRYIVLAAAPWEGSDTDTRPIKVKCEGVHGILIDLPESLSEEWLNRLKTLGLSQLRSIAVWPVGIPPRAWDGEGRVEWLTTDTPCLGIRSDHPIDNLAVVLDHDELSRIQFPPVPAGRDTFIGLPELPIGSHNVTFRARVNYGRSIEDVGHLQVLIREPQEWVPSVTSQGLFIVLLDPNAPSFEQLWEGRVAAEIHGPAARQVNCVVTFKERQSEKPLVSKQLPTLTLPVSVKSWQEYLEKYVRDKEEFQSKYDTAHSCRIEFQAEELGRFAFECEREFVPLRWVLRSGDGGYELRIIDDSGSEGPLNVTWYKTISPDIPNQLSGTDTIFYPPPAGGLYTAKAATFFASILVPPFEIRRLEDLGIQSVVIAPYRANEELASLIAVAEMWAGARLPGQNLLAAIRRRNDVADRLIQAAVREIAGSEWSYAETRFRRYPGPNATSVLSRAISSKKSETAISIILERDYQDVANLSPRERAGWFFSIATKFVSFVDSKWLCEFALRLASCSVGNWADARLQGGIEMLRRHAILLRAARFLVLSMATCFQQRAAEVGPIYPGWRWE